MILLAGDTRGGLRSKPCSCGVWYMSRLGPATPGVTWGLFLGHGICLLSTIPSACVALPRCPAFCSLVQMLVPGRLILYIHNMFSYNTEHTDTGIGNFIGLGNFKPVSDQTRDNSKYHDYSKRKNFRSILMENSYFLNLITGWIMSPQIHTLSPSPQWDCVWRQGPQEGN